MTRRWLPYMAAGSVLLGAAVLAPLLDLVTLPVLVRVACVLAFLAVGPGHGWVGALGRRDLVLEVGLMAGLGLSLALLVALTMAALSAWSPTHAMAWLLGFTLSGSLAWALSHGGRERAARAAAGHEERPAAGPAGVGPAAAVPDAGQRP